MRTMRRLLNPLSTRRTGWWCHRGLDTARGGGVTVVVSEQELDARVTAARGSVPGAGRRVCSDSRGQYHWAAQAFSKAT